MSIEYYMINFIIPGYCKIYSKKEYLKLRLINTQICAYVTTNILKIKDIHIQQFKKDIIKQYNVSAEKIRELKKSWEFKSGASRVKFPLSIYHEMDYTNSNVNTLNISSKLSEIIQTYQPNKPLPYQKYNNLTINIQSANESSEICKCGSKKYRIIIRCQINKYENTAISHIEVLVCKYRLFFNKIEIKK